MENKQLKQFLLEFFFQTKKGTGDSDSHAMPLFGIALAKRGKIYVELGVRDGLTTLPILLAAHLNGGMLYSIDIQDTSFVCPVDLKSNWKFIKGDALKFLETWDESNKIDVIFIDDSHTYPHVKRELALLERLVTPSSIILMHDLMYGKTEPRYHTNPAISSGYWAYGGPYRAVSELDINRWEWATLPWASGLTLLRKKAPLFRENQIKIWAKRIISAMPKWGKKLTYLYKKIKS